MLRHRTCKVKDVRRLGAVASDHPIVSYLRCTLHANKNGPRVIYTAVAVYGPRIFFSTIATQRRLYVQYRQHRAFSSKFRVAAAAGLCAVRLRRCSPRLAPGPRDTATHTAHTRTTTRRPRRRRYMHPPPLDFVLRYFIRGFATLAPALLCGHYVDSMWTLHGHYMDTKHVWALCGHYVATWPCDRVMSLGPLRRGNATVRAIPTIKGATASTRGVGASCSDDRVGHCL